MDHNDKRTNTHIRLILFMLKFTCEMMLDIAKLNIALMLMGKPSLENITPTVTVRTRSVKGKYKDLLAYSELIAVIDCVVETSFPDGSELSEKIRRSIRSIRNLIRFYRKCLSYLFFIIVSFLREKNKFKNGIGKGVEGYIPFITWARGSLNSQLVNQHSLLTS
jgi:hypothetical protein